MPNKNYVNIGIYKDTRDKLKKFKSRPDETWDNFFKRIIKILKGLKK